MLFVADVCRREAVERVRRGSNRNEVALLLEALKICESLCCGGRFAYVCMHQLLLLCWLVGDCSVVLWRRSALDYSC